MSKQQSSAYREAGVDIDAKYEAVSRGTDAIRSTYTAGVLGDVGAFGGLFDLEQAGVTGELLVASTDGVGTKVKVAQRCARLGGVGQDLVNHCVNDILVQGARPLFFLDYIAVDTMVPAQVASVLEGLAKACRTNGMALLGGETAEMPGVYREGEMDIAGTIIGSVAREDLLDGSRIEVGDVALALVSSGLHTNGYSLARRILFDQAGLTPDARPEELAGATVADALLAVHRSYLAELSPALRKGLVHGLAHITGGGLWDNVPRVLPAGCSVEFDRVSMPRPPIFDLLCSAGEVSDDEAYRVFNMGFGIVVFTSPDDVAAVQARIADHAGEVAHVVGRVIQGDREVFVR